MALGIIPRYLMNRRFTIERKGLGSLYSIVKTGVPGAIGEHRATGSFGGMPGSIEVSIPTIILDMQGVEERPRITDRITDERTGERFLVHSLVDAEARGHHTEVRVEGIESLLDARKVRE